SAIALAAGGIDTIHIAPPAQPDHRTTALLASSVTALDTLGICRSCKPHTAPLKKLRIVDDTSRLFRVAEVLFDAAEIECNAFGYNIENRHLLAALQARAAALGLTSIAWPALAIERESAAVTIKLAQGKARVRLAIGADGARSLCRTAAAISPHPPAYPHTPLPAN